MKFTLGADPELFMADRMGQLKAACDRIGGSKSHPMPMGIGEGYMIQEDNVAIEFNIPPAYSKDAFADSLDRAIQNINKNIDEMYGFRIVNLASASFPKEELESPAAKVFGCDPDFNAWTGRKNPRPKADDPNLRSCGGHVHVGYDVKMCSPYTTIKFMDLFLGVPSVLMDEDEKRKNLYGKSGACRVKSYGVEYRTLSNFWVLHKPLREWVWSATEKALIAADLRLIDIDHEQEAIQTAIDKNNKEVARELVNKYKLEVVSV
jgi:hypothetical protein